MLVTSASNTLAVPPSSLIIPRVSSARSATESASKTLAPSRANRTEVALPLPMPGPLDPAPATIAALPSSLGCLSGTDHLHIWIARIDGNADSIESAATGQIRVPAGCGR